MSHSNMFPSEPQRLAARERPESSPVMYQEWRHLLFLHWEFAAETIQRTLPEGLFVDTFHGRAYLGIVPFFMRNVRPCFLPAVPGLSTFLELNLRTYVHDRTGTPGVWFYSLDANQALAVEIARRLFHLPYQHAAMTAQRTNDGAIRYESKRRSGPGNGTISQFEYRATAPLTIAAPGTLEFFLVERYHLYSHAPGGLRRGTVHHAPYPLCQPELRSWDENLLPLNDFPRTHRPPDHVIMSPGVDVMIFPLEKA